LKSRRAFLRLAGSVAIGVGALLISDGLVGTQLLRNEAENSAGLLGIPIGTNSRASLINVKVYYTMMAQYTELSEEEFVLESPASLQDLLNTCVVRHPDMAQMIGTMLILLNGISSKPSAVLRDGDIVQFIPLSVGG
jgi:molybdopterin converting factor small subunit